MSASPMLSLLVLLEVSLSMLAVAVAMVDFVSR